MNICITGASSGIGRALTKILVQNGHAVWGIGRTKGKLEELKYELGSNKFHMDALDVQNASEVAAAQERMREKNFIPDVFVLAAGIFSDDINPGFNYETLKQNMGVNFYGAINFVNAFLPEFIARGSGQFIALSSTTALKPSLRGVGYGASKAALGIAFRGLDLKYRKQGVAFSTIYFGPAATAMWNAKKSFVVMSPEKAASHIARVIQKKPAVYYAPFLATLPARLSFISDKFYIWMTELFR